MRHRPLILAVLALPIWAGARHSRVEPTGLEKLDPAVRAAVDSGRPAQVIVLGRKQLFEPVGGLESFERRNAGRDRLALRAEVIASLKRAAHDDQKAILASLGKPKALRSLWIVNAMVVSLTPDEIKRAAALDDVRFVYPSVETIPTAESPSTVSDVLPVRQRAAFDPSGKRIGWNVERIGATRVWRELGITGQGVTVAVLDGGVNYEHTDLRNNIWVNRKEIPGNGVDDDKNGYVDDVYGYNFAQMRAEIRDTSSTLQHGTMTSGIIGGDGSGGIVTGVAPRVRLMPMIGSGVTAAALAYQYALENGADIISMSFSIPNLGNVRGVWRMMSDHAVAAGAVLVGGAGNFRTTAQIPVQHQSPKDVPSVISVAGVDSMMQLVPFSSGGPAEWGTVALYGDYPMPKGLVKPDVVAFPGPFYPMLAPADSGYIDPNDRVRGNSFSGPHGAGVAALMLSAAPKLPAWRVKEILEQTAKELGPPGKDNDFGAGLIDAFAAVSAAKAERR
jgi:serine protease AprX